MGNRLQSRLGKHPVPMAFGGMWNGLEKSLCLLLSVGFGKMRFVSVFSIRIHQKIPER
jgi:hypothetical protein